MAKKKITMTYGEVIKLNACIERMEGLAKGLTALEWVKISKIKYDIDAHFKAIIDGRNKMSDKYIVKENGKYKVDEDGTGFVYKKEGDEEKYTEELEKFAAETVEVQFEQVKSTAIAKATFDNIPGVTTFFHHCVN